MIARYCQPCGENLLPEQHECPFCGQMSVSLDEMAERCSYCGREARWHNKTPFACGKGGCPLGGDQ